MAKPPFCPSDMRPIARLKNAGLFIPGGNARNLVLRGINLEIPQGSHWLLTGPNGAGKSTLLRLLHGDLWASEGSIEWLGPNGYEKSPIVGKSISCLVVPAEQERWQRMGWQTTPAEMLANALPWQSPGQDSDSVSILASLGAADIANVSAGRLSQGQLRLALLAAALATRPKLLLLDECVDGLDADHKNLVFEALKAIAPVTAIIFTSHHPGSLPAWVNSHCHMRDGSLFPGPEPARQTVHFSPPAQSANNLPGGGQAQILARVANADVYIDRNRALRKISWELRQGENWRIAGENGSGKSTFLRLLAGDEVVAAGGSIERFCPKTGSASTMLEEIRRDFCLVSDLGQALYGYPLTGLELVCSGFDNSIGVYREFCAAEKDHAMRLLKMFFGNMAQKLAQTSIRRLSSGQLRGLHLCRALAPTPAVLLLDEPCTGLDAESRSAYLQMLDRLAAGEIDGWRPQLVFVSHYSGEAPHCINRHATMKDGHLIITG